MKPAINIWNEYSQYGMRIRRPQRRAFSLLEVILALALTGMIVGAIAMAIQLHLVALKKQQEGIERALIARNVMEVLATDIRAAMQYKPYDSANMVNVQEAGEGLSGDAVEQAADGLTGGETGGVTAGGGSTGSIADVGSMLGGDPASEPVSSDDIQGSSAVLCRPGFYGNATEMMFDISRLPRMDQYNPMVISSSNMVSIPSDVKTTSYFLDTTGQLGGDPLNQNSMGGLYRRQLDHATADYANENGTMLSSKATTELLATEVVEVNFRYFDGEDWQTDWNSDDQGGFPMAVEIAMIIDPRRKEGENVNDYTGFDPNYMKAYRTVVHLPMAEILSEEEQALVQGATQQSVAGSGSEGDTSGGGDR
jgi:type II secretory pathway pseudopilin PulG